LQVRSPSNSLVMNDTDRTPYRDTVDTFTTLVSGDYVFRIRFITANVTMNDVVIELIYEDISGGVASACGGLTFLIMAFILIIIAIPLIISHFVGGDKADDKAKIRPASEIVDVNIGPTPPPQQQMRVVQQPMGYPPQGMPPQQPPQQGGYPPQGMPPQQAGQPPQYGYGGVGPRG
ncbi:MAG: hypothetical protein ACMUHB_01790, partial [Thermoplasmatota archaeon]